MIRSLNLRLWKWVLSLETCRKQKFPSKKLTWSHFSVEDMCQAFISTRYIYRYRYRFSVQILAEINEKWDVKMCADLTNQLFFLVGKNINGLKRRKSSDSRRNEIFYLKNSKVIPVQEAGELESSWAILDFEVKFLCSFICWSCGESEKRKLILHGFASLD